MKKRFPATDTTFLLPTLFQHGFLQDEIGFVYHPTLDDDFASRQHLDAFYRAMTKARDAGCGYYEYMPDGNGESVTFYPFVSHGG